jgi:hypothetical protein
MTQLIAATGQGFVGASGVHSFDASGDVGGNGYCVGTFNYDATADEISFDCDRHVMVSSDGTPDEITTV